MTESKSYTVHMTGIEIRLDIKIGSEPYLKTTHFSPDSPFTVSGDDIDAALLERMSSPFNHFDSALFTLIDTADPTHVIQRLLTRSELETRIAQNAKQ